MTVYAVCRRLPRAAPAALALVSVAFAARTYTRNFDWFDDLSLWTSAAQTCPASYKTHTYLASYWVAAKEPRLDTAVGEARPVSRNRRPPARPTKHRPRLPGRRPLLSHEG